MAYLNNLYIFVETDDMTDDVESTSHPVEKGIDITDTIIEKPVTISLNGRIVDNGKEKAATILAKIKKMQKSGSVIKYRNANVTADNMQIQSLHTQQSADVYGGFVYDMELKQVRFAKNSYTAPKTTKKKKTAEKTNTVGTIKVGSKVVFKGGNVYVSSDATKAAAKRGRSTCKVTIINTKSWAKHQYHLISTDGGKVYGWVDKSNIQGISTKVKAKSSSGTQQVSKGKNKAVYHKVKKGECVYNLVTKNYKELGKTCQWVINNNPSAFSRKGDPKTLKIGAKLLMGYK